MGNLNEFDNIIMAETIYKQLNDIRDPNICANFPNEHGFSCDIW